MNIPRSVSQPRKTSSLLHQVIAGYNYYEYYKPSTQNNLHQVKARYNYEYSSFCKPTTQNKFAFTTEKKHVRNNYYEYSSF